MQVQMPKMSALIHSPDVETNQVLLRRQCKKTFLSAAGLQLMLCEVLCTTQGCCQGKSLGVDSHGTLQGIRQWLL